MRVKIFFLILLNIWLCQVNLFPTITSRIEGTVVDKDTGEPILGAWVNLFVCTNPIFKDFCSSRAEQRTNSRGEFKFEKLGAGQYFIVVVHRGYVVYGPAYELREYLGANTRGELKEETFVGGVPQVFFENKPERNFNLEEGQIKHFIIQLERATELEITAKIKLPSGISVFEEEVIVWMCEPNSEEGLYALSFMDGFFKSRCMPALGNVILKFSTRNYATSQIPGINLEKGKLEKVEIIFDYTIGQTVHGFIRSKELSRGLPRIRITMYPKGGGIFLNTTTDRNGEFWFGGIKPGEYTLNIIVSSNLIIKETLAIKQDEKIEFTKEF